MQEFLAKRAAEALGGLPGVESRASERQEQERQAKLAAFSAASKAKAAQSAFAQGKTITGSVSGRVYGAKRRAVSPTTGSGQSASKSPTAGGDTTTSKKQIGAAANPAKLSKAQLLKLRMRRALHSQVGCTY